MRDAWGNVMSDPVLVKAMRCAFKRRKRKASMNEAKRISLGEM